MEPIRPIIEEKASSVCRYSVGYSSDVNRYSDVNTTEIPNLPSKNNTRRSVVRSETQMVAPVESSEQVAFVAILVCQVQRHKLSFYANYFIQ